MNELDQIYHFKGYNVYKQLRENRRGGGLVLFVKDKHDFSVSVNSFEYFESITGLLSLNGSKVFNIIAVYRPPNLSKHLFINELEEYIENILGRNAVLFGDVNIDLFDINNNYVCNYENLLAANGFIKCIYGSTREEIRLGKLTSSCIDHIFVRLVSLDLNSAIFKTKLSDHYMVMTKINFNETTNTVVDDSSANSYKIKINESLLQKELKACDWNTLDKIDNCIELYDAIAKKFNDCYKYASYHQLKNRSKTKHVKSWITCDIIAKVKNRDKLFKKWKQCKNICIKMLYREDYVKSRNEVKKLFERAKIVFFKDSIERARGCIKSTWQTINSFIGKKE